MDAQEFLEQARQALQDAASENNAPAAPPAWHGAPLPRGFSNINEAIEIAGCDLLNADDDAGRLRVLFDASKPGALGEGAASTSEPESKDWIESGADDQLLLFVPFHSTVKLHSIQITSLPSSSDDDEPPMRPATIKLFTNRSHPLDFSEADDTEPEQTIDIGARDWNNHGTATIGMRMVKFQNVSTLIVYVVRGDGDGSKVRLDRIRLIGETGEKRQGKIEKIKM